MGLDQYAYIATKAIEDERSFAQQRELAYWRKHPNLQGWMERLWIEKGRPNIPEDHVNDSTFNGVELELTWEDLERLEKDITDSNLPYTEGFFFGSPSDDYYREQDLKFIREAKAELFLGLRVFYNSSW
jgi:hypothetical protein